LGAGHSTGYSNYSWYIRWGKVKITTNIFNGVKMFSSLNKIKFHPEEYDARSSFKYLYSTLSTYEYKGIKTIGKHKLNDPGDE